MHKPHAFLAKHLHWLKYAENIFQIVNSFSLDSYCSVKLLKGKNVVQTALCNYCVMLGKIVAILTSWRWALHWYSETNFLELNLELYTTLKLTWAIQFCFQFCLMYVTWPSLTGCSVEIRWYQTMSRNNWMLLQLSLFPEADLQIMDTPVQVHLVALQQFI